MRKILFILSCLFILQSCDIKCDTKKETTKIETKVEETNVMTSYTDLTPPILVVAVAKETPTSYSCILLRDSKGKTLTLKGDMAEGAALSQSYKAGDYIK